MILIRTKYLAITALTLSLLWHQPASCRVVQDTLVSDKNALKSLFPSHAFDATQPYMAQLNPRAVSFVQEYIRKQGKELERMKSWGKPYFDLYDHILDQYGIPREMKYLSVIESHLQSGLVSWAGAVGPWQLMGYEAKRFGLHVGGNNDERMDFLKSTTVAARLMKELYQEFGDWLLVVAAYNGGTGRVRQAIRKAGSRDFWELQYYLPEETRNHVKKFIATHYIFEGGGGWTTMTASETAAEKARMGAEKPKTLLSDAEWRLSDSLTITGRYNSLIVANGLLMDINEFNRYNPGFDHTLAEGKQYLLRLPKDKLDLFQVKKDGFLMASLRSLLESAGR
ncbi:MAG TPA: lytic transglycosylase domain-containing protein [Sediminibacterium sp.]|nr:lytic transglycosylase domain-containing protein [Sediminibacterium sp.]